MKWAAPLAALLLLLPLAPAPAAAATEARVEPLVVDATGARGLVGIPAGEPTALVLILHGYGHQAESHRGHLQALAERGALAVAMDYRGPKDGFPLAAGAQDSCDAYAHLAEAHPDVPSYLYSVSMGTAVAALVLPACPVFDAWIVSEGLSMLHETWAGAKALSPSGNPTAVRAAQAIEEECGGTPADSWHCYWTRSAAIQAFAIVTDCSTIPSDACRELVGVHLAHGLHDGLVPYNQGRELVAALRAKGIPADFTTVVRGEACQEGTTILGYAKVDCTGFAGHGSESNDRHTLTALTFGMLYDLVEGKLAPPADRELVVDREFGTLP